MTQDDIRWKQRFQNFDKAVARLDEAITALKKEPDNRLYELAVIQAFEFTYELGWKTLKDYLNFTGIPGSLPRHVIKEGFNHQILVDGKVWIDMLEDRNLMSHTYDEANAQLAIEHITQSYQAAILTLRDTLAKQLDG